MQHMEDLITRLRGVAKLNKDVWTKEVKERLEKEQNNRRSTYAPALNASAPPSEPTGRDKKRKKREKEKLKKREKKIREERQKKRKEEMRGKKNRKRKIGKRDREKERENKKEKQGREKRKIAGISNYVLFPIIRPNIECKMELFGAHAGVQKSRIRSATALTPS